MAVGKRFGQTKPCDHRNCGTCKSVNKKQHFRFNKKRARTTEGSCSSYNIIYLIVCSLCNKIYIGRSCRALRTRFGEHRRYFYKIVNQEPFDTHNDDFALGAHLYNDHHINNVHEFNNIYSVCMLEICSPRVLEVKEHRYIHNLDSLSPAGLNIANPFSIAPLYRYWSFLFGVLDSYGWLL